MAVSLCTPLEIDALRASKHQRITKHLPKPLLLAHSQRTGNVTCHGLALPRGLQWPFHSVLDKLLSRQHQVSQSESAAYDAVKLELQDAGIKTVGKRHQVPLKALFLDATVVALQVGLRWTGVALRLAKIVVEDVRRSLASVKLPRPVSSEKQAQDLMRTAQAQLLQKAQRQLLEKQGKDAAFMQMLKTLDRCHMDHEEKWASFIKLSADKAEFSKRWQHLYDLAMESKAAVDTLLRPDASRREINSFWKSAQTSAIIAEEDALKQLVFAQVFQAGRA